MGVFGIAEEIALEIEQFVEVAVADVFAGGCLIQTGMDIVQPSGNGAGCYVRVGRKL